MINPIGNSPIARWKRTLLALCSLLISAVGPLAVSAIPTEYVLFRPGPYLETVEQVGLYRRYPALMLDFAASGGNLFVPGLGDILLRYLRQRGAEQALVFLFPEKWVQGQVKTLVERYWAYYNFESTQLDLSLDFTEVKARLSGEEGIAVIREGVVAWPVCSVDDDLRILGLLLQGKTEDLPQCKPPDKVQEAFLGALQAGLGTFAQTIPEQVQLLPLRSSPPEGVYPNFRLGLRCMPVFLLLFCLLAAGLLEFSPRRFWAWSAIPFYSAGLACALSAALLTWLARWISLVPLGLLPVPAAELYSFFSQVFLLVCERTLFWTAVGGLIFAAAGMVLYLLHLDRRS
jgi:hypothetical protein